MKNSMKLFYLGLVLVLGVLACTKVADLPYYNNGKSVVLSANFTSITSTLADSNRNVISFNWTTPEYNTDTTNYKFVLSIDTAGRNFAREVTKTVMGVRSTAFTGRELNDILLNFGFALGGSYSLDVKVSSSYGNNNQKYESNVLRVTVSPFDDPSVLRTKDTLISPTLATSTNAGNTFKWTRSFTGYSGQVTYTLQYDTSKTGNFVSPLELPIGAYRDSLVLTEFQMNETALTRGVVGGTQGKIDYRIKAVTAQGAISYSNKVSVRINTFIPILRYYMAGSYQSSTGNGNDWDPGTAPEFIRDVRAEAMNKLYYMYIYLPGNTYFKVTRGRSWDTNFGAGSNNNIEPGTMNNNFFVSTAGVYRVSIDMANMKFDIRQGRMGFVGGASGAGWNPGSVFPNYGMSLTEKNLFIGLTNFTADIWKMIDNNDWPNADISAFNNRGYGATGGSGSTMTVNDFNNMAAIPSDGRYRVFWDGRDVDNIKYHVTPASQMRIVGDGLSTGWNLGASPQMTYSGNGVWTISIALIADKSFKFVSGGDWNDFKYMDASGGLQSTGTPRRIRWEGSDANFKTPSVSGTYTVTLNENTQTVTIN